MLEAQSKEEMSCHLHLPTLGPLSLRNSTMPVRPRAAADMAKDDGSARSPPRMPFTWWVQPDEWRGWSEEG